MELSNYNLRTPGDGVRLGGRGGFTLVETAISIALLAILLGTVAGVLLRSERFLAFQTKEYELVESGRRALTAINEQLRGVSTVTILPAPLADSEAIQFQRVIGWDAGVVELGPTVVISKQLAAGETANGVDDNGDGRIDEGSLLYADDSGVSRFITTDVLDLRFNAIPGGVGCTVRIGKMSREGELLEQSFSQSVRVRN